MFDVITDGFCQRTNGRMKCRISAPQGLRTGAEK